MNLRISGKKRKRIKRINLSVGYFNEKKFKGYHMSRTTRKMQSIRLAQVKLAKKGHVYLVVYYDRWNYNSGVYKTISAFKRALIEFINIDLVKYVMKGKI